MIYAHTGAAMAASPSDRNAPIAAFLVASWLPDLTGIGHWLPFTVVLSAIMFVVGRRYWSTRAGIALALLVWSHLLLDLVVGLQIWPDGRFIGLNLTTHSLVEFAIEIAVITAGYVAYILSRRHVTALVRGSFALMVGFAAVVWAFPVDPGDDGPQPAKLAVAGVGLIITTWMLIVADRRSRSVSSTA